MQGGRNWGGEGAQAPPSFLDLFSKNFKISQIRDENFFFYLVVPPHKKFASVHPEHRVYFKNILLIAVLCVVYCPDCRCRLHIQQKSYIWSLKI